VSGIDLLAPGERERLVTDWNDTAVPVPELTLGPLFEAQVARDPDAPAVVSGPTELSYLQINQRANRLARYLVSAGVRPEVFVGIALPRNDVMLAALLAVAKAGGAFVPIDAAYPATRIAFMLADAAPMLVITDRATAGVLPAGTPLLVIDDPAAAAAVAGYDPGDLAEAELAGPLALAHPAYVIYTSGSTGLPKGVVVTHQGLASMALSQTTIFGAGPGARVMQFCSLSFDGSIWEISFALLTGAVLIFAPEELRSVDARLIRFMHDDRDNGGRGDLGSHAR
jgi:non-ribosomal peptide synthetase component F